jgi:Ca2+-binding EF-hand superfamily protein
MRHLLYTSAIALAIGGLTLGAQAQESQANSQMAQSVCDAPWTEVDANGNGFVSEQEASGAVAKRFNAMDTDGDGTLDYAEYQACLSATSEMQAAKTDRSKQNFQQADANQDQEITADEYRELARQSYDNVQEAQVTDVEAEPFVVLRRYIWLTPEEANDSSAMKNMSADEAAARAAWNFAALDQNNDDRISVEEWREHTAASTTSESDMRARFNEMDADSSDSVSSEEYSRAQTEKFDTTTTASVDSGDSGQTSTDASGSDEGLGNHGVPVYVFRFLPY